jgi:hypothetical protein
VSRTIVSTTAVGWYIDASDPDGPRVRKKDGDTIITLDEFQASRGNGAGNRTATQERAATAVKALHQRRAERKAAGEKPQQTDAEKSVPTTTSETGKILRGKTTVVKCEFKGEDGESGPVCGKQRTIKVQDRFQVKYCVEHQAAHRRKIKRQKLKAKRQAAKAAAAK